MRSSIDAAQDDIGGIEQLADVLCNGPQLRDDAEHMLASRHLSVDGQACAILEQAGDALLRIGIGYRWQEKGQTTLARAASHALRSVTEGKKPAPAFKIGTRLVRSWNGRTITVITDEQGFFFEERRYRSLSAIAKEVTGAHWSGPRFFGLQG